MNQSKRPYLYACVVMVLLVGAGVVVYQRLATPRVDQVKYEFAKAAVVLDDLTIGIEQNYGLIVGLGVKTENSIQPSDAPNGSKPGGLTKEVEMIVYLDENKIKELGGDIQIRQEAVKSLVTKPIEYIKAGMNGVDSVHVKLRRLDPTIIENNQKLKKEMQGYRKFIQEYENTHPVKTSTA